MIYSSVVTASCRRIAISAFYAIATLYFASSSQAQTLADFHRDYPAAVAQLQEAYDHVHIEAQKTTRDNSEGKGSIDSVLREEFARDSSSIRYVRTVIQSQDPKLVVGTTSAAGGNAENSFSLIKPNDNTPFVINRLSGIPHFETTLRLHYYPLFATYCLLELRVIDYIKDPAVRVLSAGMTKVDDADAFELLVEKHTPDGDVKRSRFLFQPRTWALLGWYHAMRGDKFPLGQQAYLTCKIIYEPGSAPPKLRSLQYWTDTVPISKKSPFCTYNITQLDFGPVPKRLFTLQSFGVEEPARPTSRSSWTAMALISLIVLGLLFYWLAHHRRPSGMP